MDGMIPQQQQLSNERDERKTHGSFLLLFFPLPFEVGVVWMMFVAGYVRASLPDR